MSAAGRLAIDIVLLPGQKITDMAVGINAGLRAKAAGEITLAQDQNLPHITLAMGCVPEDRLNLLFKKMARTAQEFGPLEIRSQTNRTKNAWMAVQLTPELESLHAKLMEATAGIFSHDARGDDFLLEPETLVSDSTLSYVRNFKAHSAYDCFLPHITVGINGSRVNYEPFSFKARRLYAAHMGDHCVAGKILFDCPLGGE